MPPARASLPLMPAGFAVETNALDRASARVAAIAEHLAAGLRELGGVQHARNAAGSAEVAAAMTELSDSWGAQLAQLDGFISQMAEQLHAAAGCYVSTDAKAADWMRFVPQVSPQLAPAP
jgi:hypothetical protein